MIINIFFFRDSSEVWFGKDYLVYSEVKMKTNKLNEYVCINIFIYLFIYTYTY
jgi:hypothetical protein